MPAERQVTLEPSFQVFNAFSGIAVFYCAISAWIFFTIGHSVVLGYVHLVAFLGVIAAWSYVRTTGQNGTGVDIILVIGTGVVSALFVTGGWDGSGYLWTFGYLPYAALLTTRHRSVFWLGLLAGINAVWLILEALGIVDVPYTHIQLFNYFFDYLIFGACIYLFHVSLERYRTLAEKRSVELEKTNSQFATAERMTHVGSFEWDAQRDALVWSDELHRIYGIEGGEGPKTYQEFLKRIDPQSVGTVTKAIGDASARHGVFEFDEIIVRPNGERRFLHTRGKVVPDREGKPASITGACQDVTERVSADKKFREHAEELEKMNEAMVGREMQMVKLKERIKELERRNETGDR